MQSRVVTINARKCYTLDLTTPLIIPFALLSQGCRNFRLLKVGIRQKLASSMRNSKVVAGELADSFIFSGYFAFFSMNEPF